uniref:F-box domain-containing protein n=1 Tax=Lotus japonicus TaxID=34305 RepID=I3T7R1_LOTJA|nr:unknown [Lotus japonicus]
MSNSTDEMLLQPNAKRGRRNEIETDIEENKDRLSDLPDCILLYILSFVKAKHVVQTCVLSKRWKDLWKHLPTLILHSLDFTRLSSFKLHQIRVSPSDSSRSLNRAARSRF